MPINALDGAFDVSRFIKRRLAGQGVAGDLRAAVAWFCLARSLEHFKAMALLLRRGQIPSALSLSRVQFEAYIAGVWIAQCADDPQVARANDGQWAIGIRDMCHIISQKADSDAALAASRWPDAWSSMSAGATQDLMPAAQTQSRAGHGAERTTQTLKQASLWALLTGLEIAGLSGNALAANQIRVKIEAVEAWIA